MTESDGKTTQLQKGQASAAARIDMLEERIAVLATVLEAMRERVAALEALQGIEDPAPAPTLWNSKNGRYVIGAALIAFLAFIGWEANDIAAFFSTP